MNFITLLLIAIGLSIDAATISMSNRMTYKKDTPKGIYCAIIFGIFQGVMPIIGYFLSCNFIEKLQGIEHYIIFGVLVLLGVKNIKDAFSQEEKQTTLQKQSWLSLITQAFATSIDALSIGLTFAVMQVNIYFAGIVIGIVTFIICLIAYLLADKFQQKLGNKGGFYGGVLLILVAIKAVIEHSN